MPYEFDERLVTNNMREGNFKCDEDSISRAIILPAQALKLLFNEAGVGQEEVYGDSKSLVNCPTMLITH